MQISKLPKGIATILEHVSSLEDPRVTGRILYSLEAVVVIGILGVLCCTTSWRPSRFLPVPVAVTACSA